MAGGFTWRVGEELEIVSPQQVWRAGRETLNSSTQRHKWRLWGSTHTSGSDAFLGADLPPKRALREITAGYSADSPIRSAPQTYNSESQPVDLDYNSESQPLDLS